MSGRSSRGRRRLVVVGLILLVGSMVLALISPALVGAAFGADDPTGSQLEVDDASVGIGQAFTVSGVGFAPNSGVSLILEKGSVDLGRPSVDRRGRFQFVVALPSNTALGKQVIRAVGVSKAQKPRILTATVEISKVGAKKVHRGDSLSGGGTNNSASTTSAFVIGGSCVVLAAALMFWYRWRVSRRPKAGHRAA